MLLAEYLESGCYDSMFEGCANLKTVVCYALDMTDVNNWLKDTAPGKITIRAGSTFVSGASGIPADWTIKETSIPWRLEDNVPTCAAIPNSYVTAPDAEVPAKVLTGQLVEELRKAGFVMFFNNIFDVDSRPDWKPMIIQGNIGGTAAQFKPWFWSVLRIWGSAEWSVLNGQIDRPTRDIVALVQLISINEEYALVRYPIS